MDMQTKPKAEAKTRQMTGAEIVITALKEQGVDVMFGYPGGAVLPIYAALFTEPSIQHVLVRHEQGAGHAAEGYARSTQQAGLSAECLYKCGEAVAVGGDDLVITGCFPRLDQFVAGCDDRDNGAPRTGRCRYPQGRPVRDRDVYRQRWDS